MMCLVLLGGVWEPKARIVKWRTHVFTSEIWTSRCLD